MARTAQGLLVAKARMPESCGAAAAHMRPRRGSPPPSTGRTTASTRAKGRRGVLCRALRDALKRWRAYPLDCTAGELLTRSSRAWPQLLLCAVTAADERVDDAWRREPASALRG